jgi:hypothetical protein
LENVPFAKNAAIFRERFQSDINMQHAIENEVVHSSSVALVPREESAVGTIAEHQISQIVDQFWDRTQALAEQNTLLLQQQNAQASSHQNDLLTIHTSAEQTMKQFAEFQRKNTVYLETLMKETRVAMQHELHDLVSAVMTPKKSSKGKFVRFL